MPGQHAPYNILINLDVEDQGDLVGYALVTEVRVSAFHLEDCRYQFRRRPAGARFATSFRCEQQAVLPFHQCSMEAENCGWLQDNGGAYHTGRAHEGCTEPGNKLVTRSKVRCSYFRTPEFAPLVFVENTAD